MKMFTYISMMRLFLSIMLLVCATCAKSQTAFNHEKVYLTKNVAEDNDTYVPHIYLTQAMLNKMPCTLSTMTMNWQRMSLFPLAVC